MAQEGGGFAPPEFLSTHPSDRTRIRQIEALIPEAMQYYHGSDYRSLDNPSSRYPSSESPSLEYRKPQYRRRY